MKKKITILVSALMIFVGGIFIGHIFTYEIDDVFDGFDRRAYVSELANGAKVNKLIVTDEEKDLLKTAHLSDEEVIKWVEKAAPDIMTFGHKNYKTRMAESSNYFTKDGWKSFSLALQSARIIESIEANKQNITSVTDGTPILQSGGVVDGQYQWVAQVPVKLTYKSGNRVRKDRWIVTLLIQRVPESHNSYGLGVAQWIATMG